MESWTAPAHCTAAVIILLMHQKDRMLGQVCRPSVNSTCMHSNTKMVTIATGQAEDGLRKVVQRGVGVGVGGGDRRERECAKEQGFAYAGPT